MCSTEATEVEWPLPPQGQAVDQLSPPVSNPQRLEAHARYGAGSSGTHQGQVIAMLSALQLQPPPPNKALTDFFAPMATFDLRATSDGRQCAEEVPTCTRGAKALSGLPTVAQVVRLGPEIIFARGNRRPHLRSL